MFAHPEKGESPQSRLERNKWSVKTIEVSPIY